MNIFHCDHCENLVFFENIQCVNCGHALAYLPDVADVCSVEDTGGGQWTSPNPHARGKKYRRCKNFDHANVCNWMVPVERANDYCRSCRLTEVIPNLSVNGNKEAWYRLEVAKRRLLYTLMTLSLPVLSKQEDPERGLAFQFLDETGDPDIKTGHDDGVITISVAEADDARRERRRVNLHEPYRTLLGHFRHESGHYYWDRLIKDNDRQVSFRRVFGDERMDYGAALQRHYSQGAPADWQQRCVSAYASSHPWEDWAETWAHYLHITDTLETASACGLSLMPHRHDEPSLRLGAKGMMPTTFEKKIQDLFSLAYVLNNLNRGLGLPDGYPFVLSPPAIEKLHFVHDTIELANPRKR